MRILIANLDFEQDTYTESFSKEMSHIREYNAQGYSGWTEIFDPYGEDGECTLGSPDMIFSFGKTGFYNGIISQGHLYKDLYTTWDGYPAIKILYDIVVNPIYMPYLSQETLVAYMPHIPWDDFGDHLRLEGDDAEQFLALWETFLHQNKNLYKAVYRLEYSLDEVESNIRYIFMDKPFE